MKADFAERLRELERENARLKAIVWSGPRFADTRGLSRPAAKGWCPTCPEPDLRTRRTSGARRSSFCVQGRAPGELSKSLGMCDGHGQCYTAHVDGHSATLASSIMLRSCSQLRYVVFLTQCANTAATYFAGVRLFGRFRVPGRDPLLSS